MPAKEKKSKKNEYGTTWIRFSDIKLGGFWAYVVGIIEDNKTGARKVRIAKGKVKGKVRREKGELVYTFENENDPITQVNRLNIKNKGEWEKIKKLVDKYIAELT